MQPVMKQPQADRTSTIDANENQDYVGQYFGTGGASLAGMTEQQVKSNEFNGSMSFSYPLTFTGSRSNTPTLALHYQSGIGHSPFGLGFDIALMQISRRTSGTGTPKYDSNDTFSFNGQYLVPELDHQQKPVLRTHTFNNTQYSSQSFTPCEQERPVIIELLTNLSDSTDRFWRVRQNDNTILIFGRTAHARIANPKRSEEIFSWLLEEVVDSKGNHQRWHYKPEDTEGLSLTSGDVELNREHRANRYLKRISYGNNQPALEPYTLMAKEPEVKWLFEVVLDYGEHNLATTNINPYDDGQKRWLLRKDSFSNYRAGFEVRTHRLCHNILLFHRFDELNTDYPVLVKRWNLTYDNRQMLTLLASITAIGSTFEPSNLEQPYHEQRLPPIDLTYQDFGKQQAIFTELKPKKDSGRMPGLNNGHYQLVDLFQQGIACAVYQDKQWLYYREPLPVEKDTQGQYQLRYGELKRIKRLPTAGAKGLQLTNVTAEGAIELVNTEPGRAGFYQAQRDGQWQSFIPFEAFPSEAGHSGMQFADLTGDGRGDMVLIGPNSVRFYPNQGRKGFSSALENTNLPTDFPRTTQGQRKEMFGFSDLLGSGQPHLFHLRHNKVEVWPNLGHGRFGAKIEMKNPPHLDDKRFNPQRLFLADLDGSGTADLIYIQEDKALVYLNMLGNEFADPFDIKLPFPIDTVNQISFADVFGCGSAAMIITVTHPEIRHYAYDFSCGQKPYLMNTVNNNQGKHIAITYGSSAHEFQRDKYNDQPWISKLPLAVQVVKALNVTDEVNAITRGKSFAYHHGFYDFFEREYRGFAQVETTEHSVSHTVDVAPSAPLCRVDWFHTGDEQWDSYSSTLQQAYYQHDKNAKPLNRTQYLQDKPLNTDQDILFKRDGKRALSGLLLRSELYGMNDDIRRQHPYTAMENRFFIKLQQKPDHTAERPYSVVRKCSLESIEYQYDENPLDPKISHKLNCGFDEYGYVTDSLAITYPRRKYAGVLYHHHSQNNLWVVRNQFEYINIKQPELLLTGYQKKTTTHQIEKLKLTNDQGHFNVEDLPKSLLTEKTHPLLGQVKYFYVDGDSNKVLPLGEISAQALESHSESIVYEKERLNALFVNDDKLFASVVELETVLKEEGHYHSTESDPYWWQCSKKQSYNVAKKFYLPMSLTDEMGHVSTFNYDKHCLKLTQVTNAFGHSITVKWNYRCMQLMQMTDLNDNIFSYQYDGFGRLLASSYRGTVNTRVTGFNVLPAEGAVYSARKLIDRSEDVIGGAAHLQAYDDFNWMGQLTAQALLDHDPSLNQETANNLISELVNSHWLTRSGNIRAVAHHAAATQTFKLPFKGKNEHGLLPEQLQKLQELIRRTGNQPVCQVLVDAETFSEERKPVKTRVAIHYQDGFNRKLQEKVKVEPGSAIMVDARGGVVMEAGKPKLETSDNRWLTSGRTVFNNKGLPIQKYEPYYLNSSLFIDADELKNFGVSSTHYYDAAGRIVRLVSAKGFENKTQYHPWYHIESDHNDTLLNSPYYQANLTTKPDKNSPYYDDEVVRNINQKDTDVNNIRDLRGIEQRQATLSALPMIDTPIVKIFDGLNNLTSKIRLNHAVITSERLSAIYADTLQREKLLALLKEKGAVTAQNTLNHRFRECLSDTPELLTFRKNEVLKLLNKIHNERTIQSSLEYNIKSQLLSEQDARLAATDNKNTENHFNMAKKVKTQNVDAGTTWQLENSRNQVMWQKTGKNTILRPKYDKLNRLVQLRQQVGSKLLIRERYDYGDSLVDNQKATNNNLRGRLLRSYSQSGLQNATVYGLNGELIEKQTILLKSVKDSVSWPAAGDAAELLESDQYALSVSYNALGEQTHIINSVSAEEPQLYTIKYKYYSSGRLAEVKQKPGKSADEQVILTNVQYAANGLVLKEIHSGLVTEYEYERTTLNVMRVISRRSDSHRVVRDERIAYDPAGNVIIIRDAANNGHFIHGPLAEPVSHYRYDALYRLISAKGRKQAGIVNQRYLPEALKLQAGISHTLQGYIQQFSYDKGHNLQQVTTRSDTDEVLKFQIDKTSNRSAMTNAEQLNSVFDERGNQIKLNPADRQQTLFWNAKNQLQKAVLIAREGHNDDAEYYQYDNTGQRLCKLTERYSKDLNTVNVERVLYFGELEIRSKGQRKASATTVTNHEVVHVHSVSAGSKATVRFYRWLKGKPADQVNNQYRLTLITPSGRAQMDVTAQGELISFMEYMPFGGTAIHSSSKDSDIKLKYYRYSGKERDATGLYYYGLRYYAPWQMRWFSPDPKGNIDGLNFYSFVQNNPITYTDPNGLFFRSKKIILSTREKAKEDNAVVLLSVKRIAEEAKKTEDAKKVDKDGEEDEEEQRTEAQLKARGLINDIVSAYLNATEGNLEQTKEKVLAAYKDLKALVDAKALDSKQLGQSFQDVGRDITTARSSSESERKNRGLSPSKSDRYLLARKFDQLTNQLTSAEKAAGLSAPISLSEATRDLDDVISIAGFDENVAVADSVNDVAETVHNDSVSAVRVNIDTPNNDINNTLSPGELFTGDFTPQRVPQAHNFETLGGIMHYLEYEFLAW